MPPFFHRIYRRLGSGSVYIFSFNSIWSNGITLSFLMLNKMKLNIPFSVCLITRRLMKRSWFSLPIAAVYVLIQFSGILFAPTMWTAYPRGRFKQSEPGQIPIYSEQTLKCSNMATKSFMMIMPIADTMFGLRINMASEIS